VASERFAERLRAVFSMVSVGSTSERASPVLFAPSGGTVTTREEIARGVLAAEQDMLAELSHHPS
jgi:hypothetical protein